MATNLTNYGNFAAIKRFELCFLKRPLLDVTLTLANFASLNAVSSVLVGLACPDRIASPPKQQR